MTLKLYDTLTRTKRDFVPLDPKNVRMYVCGPTVYDFAHIGNARPVIVFDVLFRLLRHLAKQGEWDGGKGETTVTYVRNITDVDDKINARAAERGISIQELTKETARQFHEDVAALGCLPPTEEPRATDYVRRTDGKLDMITLIQRLIDNGCAYVAEGHVLFEVKKMPDYGKLARRSLDEMIAGSRVEIAPYKRDPMDFVLWKPSKEGEPSWDSPWSKGRPGWHIECSAMSGALLGDTFDIHGGGIDLMFPHHENELAQSRCAFHTPVMANYWLHNGFLQVEGEKMSKSLGNFVTIRELLKDWAGGAIRMAMLQTHYRQPINWTEAKLLEAREEIGTWVASLDDDSEAMRRMSLRQVQNRQAKFSDGLVEALADDLNTPEAVAYLRHLTSERHKGEKYAELIENCEALGLFTPRNVGSYTLGISGSAKPGVLSRNYDFVEQIKAAVANDSVDFVSSASMKLSAQGVEVRIDDDGFVSLDMKDDTGPDEIERLIAARNAARREKNFREADRIRDELAAMGVVLKDSKDGTTWEVAR